MTAVEQRGPRVYASPMAKKLAETQKLRLEGNIFVVIWMNTQKNHFDFVLTNTNNCIRDQDKAVVSSVQLHLRILQEEVALHRVPLLVQLCRPVLPMLIFL